MVLTPKHTKVKRSCIMQPRKYHKVKLKTASGGSLTIRYRRPSDLTAVNCSSASGSSNVSEIPEASVTSLGSDQSFSNACNYITASMYDQNQAFDDLADLPEYSQIRSCVSGVPDLDACDVLYSDRIQPADFPSDPFWSPDHECNSSDIGSNEVIPELPEDSCFDIPATDPDVAVNERFLEDVPENSNLNSWTTLQEMQHFRLEQTTMLSQQMKFGADGIKFASTLLSMEDYDIEELGAGFWSTSPAESIIAEETQINVASSHMNILCFPSVLTDAFMESSEVELNELAPLLGYIETEGLQDQTLHQYESNFYVNMAASCMEVNPSEDAELFDESSFLLLDPSMPEEVNLENSGMLQGPWGGLSVQDPETEAPDFPESIPVHVKEAVTPQRSTRHEYSACRDKPSRFALLEPAGEGRSSFSLSDPVATRGKNIRKRRLRRATPLHTLKSLLSRSRENVPGSDIGHDNIDRATCGKIHVFSRDRSTRSRKAKVSVADRPAEESNMNWRPAAFRRIDEIHNSDQQIYQLQKQMCSTSSEKEGSINSNLQVDYVSSQKRKSRSRADQVQRRRPDAVRRAPRYGSLLPEDAVSTLRKWFDDHISFPFADKEQKLDLVSQTGLTLTQVDNWLSNYRHRLKVKKSDYVGNVFRPDQRH